MAPLSLPMRVFYFLSRIGLIQDTGQKSLAQRILVAWSLLTKKRLYTKAIVPSVFLTALRVLLGKTRHKFLLPQPIDLDILPSNLASLGEVYAHFRLVSVSPEHNKLVWEVGPNWHLITHTDYGQDIAVMREVFLQKVYGAHYNGLQVIDIGAYHGETMLFFLWQGCQSIVVVEPYPPAVKRIEELVRINNLDKKVRLFPVAVGKENGESWLLVSPNDLLSNALQNEHPNQAPTTFSEKIVVPVWTFSRLIEEIGWDAVDVAKVDCEGGEYAILLHTPPEILKRVKVWVVEFHKGAGLLVEKFREMGYEVAWEERPDKVGMLRAWQPGAKLPWDHAR